jgi:hypothetical protein
MLAIRAIPCVGAESRDWLRSHCSWAITPLYFDHNFTGRRTGVLSYGRSSRAVLVQLYGSTLCRAELPVFESCGPTKLAVKAIQSARDGTHC